MEQEYGFLLQYTCRAAVPRFAVRHMVPMMFFPMNSMSRKPRGGMGERGVYQGDGAVEIRARAAHRRRGGK